MLQVDVYRIVTGDLGSFGNLRIAGYEFKCRTGELPWRGNDHGLSCPPAGSYRATVRWSEHFKRDLYHLEGVPGRDLIEIHHGNWVGDVEKGYRSDSHGCLLLGFSVGDILRPDKIMQQGIAQSLHALEQFHKATQEQPIQIAFHWATEVNPEES